MCVGVCITRRGMVYFGASIHIFVTLILFIGSSFRAVRLTTYEKEDSRKEILGGFIIATYFFVLLMLGCLIFRATEQKNPKLLGWTGGIFITLETFAFVINLMILSPMGSNQDEYGFRNFGFSMNLTYIAMSCIFLVCMMAYCATIIIYISKLKEDGDVSSGDVGGDGDAEASSTSNAVSRTSSRTGALGSLPFFNRSHSQPQMDNKPTLGGAGGGGGAFNILEVVKEAKRQQQLKEQKEMREKQKSGTKQPQQQQANNNKPKASTNPPQKSTSRPHTPQIQPKHGDGDEKEVSNKVSEQTTSSSQTHQGTQSEPPPLLRPPSRHSQLINQQPLYPAPPLQRPTLHDPPQSSTTKPLMKSQEQQTQTPPQLPSYHHLPPPPPNLLPNPMPYTQSQTLPHKRSQLQQMHQQLPPPPPRQYNHDHDLDHNRPYFLQEYSQRGILSAPSFASMANNTASIVPHRFRNPSGGVARTTKSGTLLNRYDCITPPPPPLTNRVQSLQRLTSSCSSFDPLNPNFDLEWDQSRGVKGYNYNAPLRRGAHRSEYGLGVEV